MKYSLDQLQPYESDKIKFMTKVEVFDQRCEGIKTKIKITKDPIYATEDVIVFLLTLQWYPNSFKAPNKARKGSFATEKELKVRFHKPALQQEEFLTIAYVLSQKVYIHERHIDAFVKAISSKTIAEHKQQNCLTAILSNGSQKRHLQNLASTLDETKSPNYWFDSSSYANTVEDRYDKTNLLGTRQQDFVNKFLPLPRRSSRFLQKSVRSPRVSMGSRDYLSDETFRKESVQFNVSLSKRWFSSVEYILSEVEIGTETIIYHLTDNHNFSSSGLRLEALETWFQQWPRSSSFSKLYKLNKQKVLSRLLEQVKSNYTLMVQMQFQEVSEKNINQIYLLINEFRQKSMDDFTAAAKEYLNEPDYNQYSTRVENQLSALENELLNNYGTSKKEYGCRILKNFERKNYDSGNYTLLKVIGRQKINKLEIGFRRYKEILIENYLQQCFEDFRHKKNRERGRFLSRYGQNHEEEELNYIENRIQICEGKKTMLDRAIELELREKQNLRMMLQILQKEEHQEVLVSERITN